MPKRDAGRTWISLAALGIVLAVVACAKPPYQASDGTRYPRSTMSVCGAGSDSALDELRAPLLASAAHDIPCATDHVNLVSTCSPICCKGAILILEGCGERVSYATVYKDSAAELTMIGRVKIGP